MATTETTVRARTGKQFLDGLAERRARDLAGRREDHASARAPAPRRGAESIARVFDLQHEHADEMLVPSPDDGSLVNVTHLIPRSQEDLERRRRAFELIAAATAGMMGRTPDYLNVTFACFAGRSDVWARRGNEQGAANLVAYQRRDARSRSLDDAHDHQPAGRPLEAGGRAGCRRGRAAQDRRDRRRASSSAAPGCSPRSRRSPTS